VACLNPDGTLTRSARAVLLALREPGTEAQIVERSSVPRFQVRSLLRDMVRAHLISEDAGLFRLSEDGADLLETVR
jgi:DNA-binding IclR family transcriptional regulator